MNVASVSDGMEIIMSQNKKVKYNEAKMWQIAFFTMNNTATNIAMFLMMQYSYFTQNVLGLAAAVIGVILTFTRIFDAITDPIVGFLIDKTNGRFGKFRPFMLVGNIIIWTSLIAIFNVPGHLPTGQKYLITTVLYVIYILGYTCQTVVTKAGQAVLTNNPQKRPLFSGFDCVFTQTASAGVPLLITTILAERNSVGEYANGLGLINPVTWQQAVVILAGISFLLTVLAMIGISQKDRPEFFGNTEGNKVGLKDYWDVIKNNRPIQMLVVSAATDKLGQLLQTGTLTYIFANLMLNSKLQGVYSSLLMPPIIAISIGGVFLSRKFGLKKTFLVSTITSMFLLIAMFIIRPNPDAPYIFLFMILLQKCIFSVGNAAVIPMIADCTDYESYRSGRFIPGMLGTMFSFIDKIISSFSSMIQGFALTLAGVGTVVILPNQAVNETFNTAILVCFCIVPIIGHVASIIAMKFYDLDKEKMEEVQEELAKRMAA